MYSSYTLFPFPRCHESFSGYVILVDTIHTDVYRLLVVEVSAHVIAGIYRSTKDMHVYVYSFLWVGII